MFGVFFFLGVELNFTIAYCTISYVSNNNLCEYEFLFNLAKKKKNFKATQEKFNYTKILSSHMPKVAITKLKENQRAEKDTFNT